MTIVLDQMLIEPIAWAPDFSVRRSLRAKRISLRIVAGRLELVLPKRASASLAHDFMLKSRAWIEQNQHLLFTDSCSLPDVIDLALLQQTYQVNFMPNQNTRLRLSEVGDSLILSAKSCDDPLALKKLRRWLFDKAKQHLPQRLATLSERTGIAYSACNVRWQRTIWGSCRQDAVISLNAKLLLCAPELADYVITHELCHILHHDHSALFWGCVARHVPDYKRHIKHLRQQEQQMPAWLDAS